MFESINIFKIRKNLASSAHSEKCIRFVFHLCKCIMEYHKYKYWGGGDGVHEYIMLNDSMDFD